MYVMIDGTAEQLHNITDPEVDPAKAAGWHCPRNEREYYRSPQRARWRTAKELKMEGYKGINMFELVREKDVPEGFTVHDTLWAYKVKLGPDGHLDKLNPRWCVKGGNM